MIIPNIKESSVVFYQFDSVQTPYLEKTSEFDSTSIKKVIMNSVPTSTPVLRRSKRVASTPEETNKNVKGTPGRPKGKGRGQTPTTLQKNEKRKSNEPKKSTTPKLGKRISKRLKEVTTEQANGSHNSISDNSKIHQINLNTTTDESNGLIKDSSNEFSNTKDKIDITKSVKVSEDLVLSDFECKVILKTLPNEIYESLPIEQTSKSSSDTCKEEVCTTKIEHEKENSESNSNALNIQESDSTEESEVKSEIVTESKDSIVTDSLESSENLKFSPPINTDKSNIIESNHFVSESQAHCNDVNEPIQSELVQSEEKKCMDLDETSISNKLQEPSELLVTHNEQNENMNSPVLNEISEDSESKKNNEIPPLQSNEFELSSMETENKINIDLKVSTSNTELNALSNQSVVLNELPNDVSRSKEEQNHLENSDNVLIDSVNIENEIELSKVEESISEKKIELNLSINGLVSANDESSNILQSEKSEVNTTPKSGIYVKESIVLSVEHHDESSSSAVSEVKDELFPEEDSPIYNSSNASPPIKKLIKRQVPRKLKLPLKKVTTPTKVNRLASLRDESISPSSSSSSSPINNGCNIKSNLKVTELNSYNVLSPTSSESSSGRALRKTSYRLESMKLIKQQEMIKKIAKVSKACEKDSNDSNDAYTPVQSQIEENDEQVKKEIQARLKSFQHIIENRFLCERRYNKQSGGLECDCTLTQTEISLNRKGCGEDCLNRLLKIECGKSCTLGKLCGNKKFQNVDNSPIEVFKTLNKGFGIRATADIPSDTFIMEYVGEVLDSKQFRKRAKKYAKDDVSHFYFMALSADYCIDATSKGNISRFINHSCAPIAETQKWMVNGEMRVGFFTKKKVSMGEEITFDYKYERYGQKAQKCFCGSDICRGWLGGAPVKENVPKEDEELDTWSTSEDDVDEAEEVQEEEPSINEQAAPVVLASPAIEIPQLPKKRIRRRKIRKSRRLIQEYEDEESVDEIKQLSDTGIRTKSHTVELCRIMVRTTDLNTRAILASLLFEADSSCRRLFLDYHGLRILSGWMSELSDDLLGCNFKLKMLDLLRNLCIPHKTMLMDSKVWQVVEDWAKPPETKLPSPSPSLSPIMSKPGESNMYLLLVKKLKESQPRPDMQEAISQQPDLVGEGLPPDIEPIKKAETDKVDTDKAPGELEEKMSTVRSQSMSLLDSWKSLKEVFKIPKKDRIALRVEHEREVDRAVELRSMVSRPLIGSGIHTNAAGPTSHYGSSRAVQPLKPESPPLKLRNERLSRFDDRSGLLHLNNLSREQRRHLFSMKAQQEEEEKRKRSLLQELHNNKCFYLNLRALETPMFPHYPDFVFNPEDGNWYQMPEPYPKVQVDWGYAGMAEMLPGQAFKDTDPPLPDRAYLYPPGVVPISYLYGIPLTTPEAYYSSLPPPLPPMPPPEELTNPPEPNYDPHESPTKRRKLSRPDDPPSFELEEGEIYSPFKQPNHPSEINDMPMEDDLKPMTQSSKTPLPSNITSFASKQSSSSSSNRPEIVIHLPPKWKMAKDSEGRPYYYHSITKETRWDPPPDSDPAASMASDGSVEAKIEVDTMSTDSEEQALSRDDEDGNNNGDDTDDEEEEDSDEESPSNDKSLKQNSDLSEFEKEQLLGLPKKKTKEERQHERRQKRERDREKREYERKRRRERHGKHRSDGLVQEHLIPCRSELQRKDPNRQSKDRTIISTPPKTSSEDKPRASEKKSLTGNNGGAAVALDTNSEPAKKLKDRFLKETSKVIVKTLDPYRRSDTVKAKIQSVDDFKHLAKKLTQFVMAKELKYCTKIEDLKCSESVKKKASEFVWKYMSKFGELYKRSPS